MFLGQVPYLAAYGTLKIVGSPYIKKNISDSDKLTNILDNKPKDWEATTKWEQKLNDFVFSLDDGLPRFRHQVDR